MKSDLLSCITDKLIDLRNILGVIQKRIVLISRNLGLCLLLWCFCLGLMRNFRDDTGEFLTDFLELCIYCFNGSRCSRNVSVVSSSTIPSCSDCAVGSLLLHCLIFRLEARLVSFCFVACCFYFLLASSVCPLTGIFTQCNKSLIIVAIR